MALTHELDIYAQGCKLLQLALRIESQLPRSFRRSMGERIHRLCMDMLEDMAMANASRGQQRVDAIDQLLTRLRAATALFRVGHDMRAPHPLIPHELWADTIEVVDAVGAKAGGWRRDALKTLGKVPVA